MFGIFKDDTPEVVKYNSDDIKSYYEGGVMSPEYEARTINRDEINEQDYPHHVLYPHGKGKLTYKIGNKVIEEYEGEFEVGQYHGKGRMIREGVVYEGQFEENKFVG